jgi:hypothetical protein
VRGYNYNYDMTIIQALYKYGNVGRRQLKKIIESKEYLNKNISYDTFYYHIKRMLFGEYICENKDEWKRGMTSPLSLTPSTREQVEFNTLVIRYPVNVQSREKKMLGSYHRLKKRELTTERYELQLKRDRIYYIVFRVLSIKAPTRHYKYPGVSVTNIINGRHDGHAFHYLRLEDYRALVEECVKHLLKLNVIKELKGLPEHEESRYQFVEILWEEFINDISDLLENDIMLRLNLVWKHLRPPTAQERLYFEWCWGRSADGKLNNVYNIFQVNKKKFNHDKKQWKDLVNHLDCNIVDMIKGIDEKYAILVNKHPLIWKTIIETVYPKYLQKEIKNIEEKSKYKRGKYPRLKRVITKDTLVFRDSTNIQ